MKILSYLYLLAADRDYRLIRTHEGGLAEIAHGKPKAAADRVHHIDGHSTKEELEHADFARQAATAMAAEWARGVYDRIVIAAGPKMLGLIREALPKALLPHVTVELHKDLVKVPLHDLPSHFGAVPVI